MSGPEERSVRVAGEAARVWERGQGARLGVLAGPHGFPTWTPFLESLAQGRRVVVPSLPGLPGGGPFRHLDDLPDWVIHTQELLEAADLVGADWVGLGMGGTLAAEVAAFSPTWVSRLVLVSPLGLFDVDEPVADFFALRGSEVPGAFSARPAGFAEQILACPEGEDAVEWQISQVRAMEAAGRLLWPTGDRGLRKRLRRIRARTLLVWGAEDRIVPASYAKRFADGIAGPTEIRSVPGAGHRADFDAPETLARLVSGFLQGPQR